MARAAMSQRATGRLRSVGMACAAVIATAGVGAPAHAEVIPLQDRVLLGEGTFQEANPCTGEPIFFTGQTYQLTAGVFFTDGTHISAGQIVTTATGVGIETGTKVLLQLRTTNAQHAPWSQDPPTSSGGLLSTTSRFVSQGPGDNFFYVLQTFVMSSPDGVTRVSYTMLDGGCIG